jgi:ornithine cyclodeaminase/alanine dehydrogenase-like protein (mu-crystallin family)
MAPPDDDNLDRARVRLDSLRRTRARTGRLIDEIRMHRWQVRRLTESLRRVLQLMRRG